MRTALPLLALLVTAAYGTAEVRAQTVQRCEAADGRISYSNQACPPGSRVSRAVAPPTPQPGPAISAAARQRVQREADIARSLEQRRRERSKADTGVAPASFPVQMQRQNEAIQRAADCGYLQGEIDATRRLSGILESRPYYSYEDAESTRALIEQLADDYRLLCGP